MRKIILDTETTGLNKDKNKIIEIGAVETFDNIPSGNVFHTYLDPLMEVPIDSTEVCGITTEMVQGKPLFGDIVKDFDDFLGDSPIVAHNASFDIGFINMERSLINLPPLKNEVIDTLKIARVVFPGMPNNLNALCKRFKVNLSKRVKHGALIDAELLAQVFFFLLEKQNTESCLFEIENDLQIEKVSINFSREPLIQELKEELILHQLFLEKIC